MDTNKLDALIIKGDWQMASVTVNRDAPDFRLRDYEGNEFHLASFKSEKHVLLVLNRGFI